MLTLAEIALAQREWSERNFPGNTPLEPLEGLIEEVGELAHSRLKRRQGIRGTAEQHIANERDAIGDIGIYLCDFAWRIGVRVVPGDRHIRNQDISDAGAFGMLAYWVGSTASWFHRAPKDNPHFDWTNQLSHISACLSLYCRLRGWDFLEIVNETWAKVSRRDWRANPVTAGEGS